jgi:hypothetical protein
MDRIGEKGGRCRTFCAGAKHNGRVIVAIQGIAKRVRERIDGNLE